MAIKELKLDLLAKTKDPQFQVRRNMLSKILEGELTATTKGRGMEFTDYREYMYGDDASQIDWPASLRAKKTLVREYEEYKNFNIFMLMDVSNSMLFSSTDKLKCEYAAELVFSIIYAIVNSGNKIGLGMFTDKLVTKKVPQQGTRSYYRMLQDLTNPENYGGKFDLRKALTQTRALLNDKSLIIIVSDFIGLDEKWKNYIRMMTQNFDILGIMVRDPRDREMPKNAGQYLVEDPYTGEKLYIDAKDYAKIYKKRVQKQEQELVAGFRTAKAGLVPISTDQDFMTPLIRFIRLREKLLFKTQK